MPSVGSKVSTVGRLFHDLAWRVAPERMADRGVAWNRRVRRETGLAAEYARYVEENGLTVSSGPFSGLTYPAGSAALVDALPAKLAGTYEAPLGPIIETAIRSRPKSVVDIGTADGYYAVGFAREAIPVRGFEIAPAARAFCAALAELNSVEVDLHAAASSVRVRALDLSDAFVLSDCEGAEASIFDGQLVAALGTAMVVIELHEWAVGGVTDLLRDRFAASHQTELIHGERERVGMRRDEGRWLICTPRRSGVGRVVG